MPEQPSQEQLLDYFASYVSPQKVKMYRMWGVDFIPGRREGVRVWDYDGKRSWIDCRSAGGVFNLGHRPPRVIAALKNALDWAYAAAGDPRADLARTEITILAAPVPPGPLSALLNLARKMILRAWRSGYREVAGQMPDFRPLRAWAGATLLGETELVLDRPGVWATEDTLEKFRRMIDVWAQEAGIR